EALGRDVGIEVEHRQRGRRTRVGAAHASGIEGVEEEARVRVADGERLEAEEPLDERRDRRVLGRRRRYVAAAGGGGEDGTPHPAAGGGEARGGGAKSQWMKAGSDACSVGVDDT